MAQSPWEATEYGLDRGRLQFRPEGETALWVRYETHLAPGVPVKQDKNEWLPIMNQSRQTFEKPIACSSASLGRQHSL
jgi:hypothetical protein